jgi:hypothetical protein
MTELILQLTAVKDKNPVRQPDLKQQKLIHNRIEPGRLHVDRQHPSLSQQRYDLPDF